VFHFELITVCLVTDGVATPADDRLKKMAVELAAIPRAEQEASWLVRDVFLKEFRLLLPHQSIGKAREATLDKLSQASTSATVGAGDKSKQVNPSRPTTTGKTLKESDALLREPVNE